MGYIFAAESICVALQVSKQFCLKAEPSYAKPLEAEPKTDFNAIAIQGHFNVIENPLSDYILQFNTCIIVRYSLENIVKEILSN